MGSTGNPLERIELPADFAEAFEYIAGTAAAPATLGECIAAFERMMEAAENSIVLW